MRRWHDSPDNKGMAFDDDFARRFSQRLNAAVDRSGMPVEKIAQAAVIDKTTINNWRRAKVGAQGPALMKLVQLAKVLRCDVAYLVGETDTFRIAHGPAQLDAEELTQCMLTVLERHNNEPPERLAARVAFLYQRRMSIAQGDLDIMQIIDDSYRPNETAS